MQVTAEDHLSWILARIEKLPVRAIDVRDAHGFTLASDAVAQFPLPLWDNSAMDGYAVRAADTVDAGTDAGTGATEQHPVALRVTGEVIAGSALDPAVARGTAVRIMTGAPVPSDADAVIPVELTRGDLARSPWAAAHVQVLAVVAAGAHIRRAGEDTSAGAVIVAAGERLGAAQLSALAAAGVERVSVRRLPRVAVITTGTELRAPGEPLTRGQIPESNSLLIVGLLRELGIEAALVQRSADDAEAFAQVLRPLASSCDVVITTGGVGPGTHDVVRIALEDEPEVRAVRVAVRPGQPQCTGRLRGGAFVFALPGNPVSAAVSFELFVRPALLAMQGRRVIQRLRVAAHAASGWRGVVDRLQVLPVRVTDDAAGDLSCVPTVNPRGVSHAVGGHGSANGYALVEVGRGDVAAGETVAVIMVAP